jgi:sporulation protein YlmC with PRC-barrel domain
VRLTDLLDAQVIDESGRSAGTVHDVRLVQDGPVLGELNAAFRVLGLVAGPRKVGGRLGYDRTNMNAPWLLNLLYRRIHRDDVLVPWDRVRSLEPHIIRMSGSIDDLEHPPDLPGLPATPAPGDAEE